MPALRLVSALLATAVLTPVAAASAVPIAPGAVTSLPQATGVATAHAFPKTVAPQNPGMARNPFSEIHNDTWQTDAYDLPGPLGRNTIATSGAYAPSLCGSIAFDTAGRALGVCPSSVSPPEARVFNPETLEITARYRLPTAPDAPGTQAFQNFTGGGYFFLDAKNRIWSATKTSHLFVLAENATGTKLTKVADYDLTGALKSDQRVTSALPDFQGRVWFVSKRGGVIGILDLRTRKIHTLVTGEEIENSFAMDTDAAYIVSDKRMYRVSAGKDDKPHIDWQVTYENSGIHKPSQVDAGSGTTPTISGGGFVSITDNADPMNVVVYRTATRLAKGQKRVVCEVAVFDRGASATENSLLSGGRSLFVENNYGYQDPFGPMTGALTQPGFARVDINAKGTGCTKVWTNTTERAPTVVPKLSTKTGLIYTYTRDDDPNGSQPWFWTAIDARDGTTAFKRYAGSGLAFNNNYAGLALGPDGSAYLGAIGGLLKLSDGS